MGVGRSWHNMANKARRLARIAPKAVNACGQWQQRHVWPACAQQSTDATLSGPTCSRRPQAGQRGKARQTAYKQMGQQCGVGGSARPALSRTRPKRAETHGDRDPKAKRAKPVSCMLFKVMPRPPNSEVKVQPTSLIQRPCHQLARETPGTTKERPG